MELSYALLHGPCTFAAEITIPATPTLVSELCAADLAALKIDAGKIDYAFVMPKVTAGTDRGAIRFGTHDDRMFLHYGAGQLAAPPIAGDLYLERVGGSDVPAVIVVGWHP